MAVGACLKWNPGRGRSEAKALQKQFFFELEVHMRNGERCSKAAGGSHEDAPELLPVAQGPLNVGLAGLFVQHHVRGQRHG